MERSLIAHSAGIIVLYSTYGVLQERILKGTFNGEHFTSSPLLILFNRIFSISFALAILFVASIRKNGSGGVINGTAPFRELLKPRQQLRAYLAVAMFNFASTACQYEALRQNISYATHSLAKTTKMIPVLLIGVIIYKKQFATKNFVAAGTVFVGIAIYLFSDSFHHKPSTKIISDVDSSAAFLSSVLGGILLLGYLLFDGLTSTTQERLFAKNASSSTNPFTPDSGVLDQMIYVNICAAGLAIVGCLVDSRGFSSSLGLLMSSGELVMGVVTFSVVSALGLIVLLSSIANFGALTTSTIMTVRQFLSIIINSYVFAGSNASISPIAWMGIGTVAAGLFIKMDRRDHGDAPMTGGQRAGASGSGRGGKKVGEEKESLISMQSEPNSPTGSPGRSTSRRGSDFDTAPDTGVQYGRLFRQYGLPILAPIFLVALLSPYLPAKPSIRGANIAPGTVLVDAGDKWGNRLVSLFGQSEEGLECKTKFNQTTVRNKGGKTGFVSYPRSGNSMTRSLVERTTGFSTSSVYCDASLSGTFTGECDSSEKNGFFIKTHWPALDHEANSLYEFPVEMKNHHRAFDQVVLMVRNPLDAIASLWHLQNSIAPGGIYNHTAKHPDLPNFGQNGHAIQRIVYLAERWRDFSEYWGTAPVETYLVKYENLAKKGITETMGLLSFLLPDDELPSLEHVVCSLRTDSSSHEAYKSVRREEFSSWDNYDPALRLRILQITRRHFCGYGYDKMLLRSGIELTTEEREVCSREPAEEK